MRSPMTLLGALLACTLLVVASEAGSAQADGPSKTAPERAGTGAAPVDPAARSLADDQHLTVREAQRRLKWQAEAAVLQTGLRRSMPARFAGMWMRDADGGRVEIAVKGDAALPAGAVAQVDGSGLRGVADVVAVRYSWADLLAMSPVLSTRLQAANHTSGVRLLPFFEPQRNRIKVYVPRSGMTPAQTRVVADARSRFPGRVAFVPYSGHVTRTACERIGTYDCDAPLRGGMTLYETDNSLHYQCSTAFNARSVTDGKWYVMTAAHCGPNGTRFSAYQPTKRIFSVVGSIHSRGDPAVLNDYAIVTINNPAGTGWNPQPWVYVKTSTGRGVAGTATDYAYTINGTSGSVVGNRVCAITAVTGTSCGAIIAVGYPRPGDYAVANYCNQGGDSGGAVVNNHLAIGINIGYLGTNPCGQAIYTGIGEAQQQLHVRVATA